MIVGVLSAFVFHIMQEQFMEKWAKGVMPKLQEDQKTSAQEELNLTVRKRHSMAQAEDAAMQEAAYKLLAHLDELHERLARLRVDAALYCEPMGKEDRARLTAELTALPTAQLEAALALILPRLAPSLASALPEVSRSTMHAFML